jgi:hypothetical protein
MSELGPADYDDLFSRNEKALVLFYAVWCPFFPRVKPIFDSNEIKSSQFSS